MANKRFTYSLLILFFVTISSCSRVPEKIIPERKMRSVLYDMKIAEAMVETNYETYPTSEERQRVYEAVFARHHITQAEYDSSLIWYGKNMDLYMSIYKLVLKDINANITAMGDVRPDPLSGKLSAKDSVDVWILGRSYTFNPQDFNPLVFDITPKRAYSSGSSYVLGFSVWGLSKGAKSKIHLRAQHADTIITANKEVLSDGYHEAVIQTVATKKVQSVNGYIMIYGTGHLYPPVYLDHLQLMKYNYGSKALTAPAPPSPDASSL